MEEAILSYIQNEKTRKESNNIYPTYVLNIDIYNEVNRVIDKLYTDGKISIGDTVNHKWIAIK